MLAVGLVVGLVTAGVAGCTADDRGGGTFDAVVDPDDCGLDALARAEKPVRFVFWHTMAASNAEWLEATTAEFNAAQGDVEVVLRQQPSYVDAFTKYKAGLVSGDLPDLAQMEETVVQQMIDSQSTIPMQACMDAEDYDTSAYLPRALAYYSAGDVQRALPWAISSPILIFDKGVLRRAGLDPDDPPETLAEVREYSEAIVESGAAKTGIALKPAAYIFEFLLAKSGGEYVDNGNGRRARAEHANLTSPDALAIFEWWRDMVADGLALDSGGDPDDIDHLLALATRDAGMTIESSGTLGPVKAVLASGEYPDVEPGAAPLPALEPGGGVPVGDGALWLPKASTPEKRAAAWRFASYLMEPEQQAGLAVAGGYIPAREDAVLVPELMAKWEAEPEFRVGYDQLLAGPVDDATVGSLIGDYQGVRDAVRDTFVRILRRGDDVEDAADDARQEADIRMQEYNDRVGA